MTLNVDQQAAHVVSSRADRLWHAINFGLAALGIVVVLVVVYTFFVPAGLQQFWLAAFGHQFPFDIDYLRRFLTFSDVLSALSITITLAVISMAVGVIFGFAAGFARMSRLAVLRVLAFLYISVWRGTPLLLQLLMVAFGVPIILESMDRSGSGLLSVLGKSIGVNPFLAGFIALSLYEGAYMAEIVRAGLLSVDRGQLEAAKALGMSPLQSMRHVVLPQALKVIVPPTGNNFIAIMKDTSLVSVIGLSELTLVSEETYSRNFRVLEVLIGAALYYLLLTTIWTVVQGIIEARLGGSDGGGANSIRRVRRSLRAVSRLGSVQD